MFSVRGRGRGRGAVAVSNDGTRQTTLFAGVRPFTRLQASKTSKPSTTTDLQTYNGRGRGGAGAFSDGFGRGGRGGGRGRGRGRGPNNNNNNRWNPWNRQLQQQQQQKKSKALDFLPVEDFGREPDEEDENDEDGGDFEGEDNHLVDRRNYIFVKRNKFSDSFADNGAFQREWAAFVALYPAALVDIREEMSSVDRRRRRDPLGPPPESSAAVVEARFAALYESLLFSEFDEEISDDQVGSQDPRRRLFVGVHIYVNGFTQPTASQLATLMQLTGGSFTWNYQPGKTTHTIATVLSQAQKRQERARLTTVLPEWILDCLEQRRILPVHEYKVLKPKNDIGKMFAAIAKRNAEKAQAEAMRRAVVVRSFRAPSPELINWREFEMEEETGAKEPVVEDVHMPRQRPQTKTTKQKLSSSTRETRDPSPEISSIIELSTPLELPQSDKQKDKQQTTPVKRDSKKRKVPVHPSPELQFVLNDMAVMDAEEKQQKEKENKKRNGGNLGTSSKIGDHSSLDLSGPDWPQKPSVPPQQQPKSNSISTSDSDSNLLSALDPSREPAPKNQQVKNVFTVLPPSTNRPPNEKPRVVPSFRRAGERRKFDASNTKMIKPKIPLDVQEYFRNLPAPDQPTASTFTVARRPPPLTSTTEAPEKPLENILHQNNHQPPPLPPPLYEQPKRLPPSELRLREFKRKLERGDESHFVSADDYMPASMSAIDAEVLAALPEDMQREMRAFVRQKNAAAAVGPKPTTSKPSKPTAGKGRGRGRGRGALKDKDKPPPGQVTLSGWVVRPPPPNSTTLMTTLTKTAAAATSSTIASTTAASSSTTTATTSRQIKLKRKASNWPELDPDLKLGSSVKLRRSSRDPMESRRSSGNNSEEVIDISLDLNDEEMQLLSKSDEIAPPSSTKAISLDPGPSTSKSIDENVICAKCHKVKLPEKKADQSKTTNNLLFKIDPSHPKAPKKPVKSQAKVDQMLQALKERKNSKQKPHRTPEEKALALLSGRCDRRLGPNLIGKRNLTSVCALLRQWIISAENADILDDDLAYVLRYFSALIDAGRQDDLLMVLSRCKEYIGEREAKGKGLEVDSWRTAFYETFPAFLRQEPAFRDMIPEELFWYAKKDEEDEKLVTMVDPKTLVDDGSTQDTEVYDVETDEE